MVLVRFVPRWKKPTQRLLASGVVFFVLTTFFVHAASSSDASPNFAAYLAQHQSQLAPFVAAHGYDVLKSGLPIIVATIGRILLVSALVGWVLDVPLVWGYATIFAPAYAKFPRALVYACGRLVLALMLTIILTFAAMVGVNAGAGIPALTIVAVLTVPAVCVQVYWVGYLYRTGPKPSLLFYVALLAVHALIFTILVPTVFSKQVNSAVTQFMDESVLPSLRAEADQEQKDVADVVAKRDVTQAQAEELQARIARDQADEKNLQAQIAEQKDSPAVQFSRLVLQRARGNLVEAGTGLAAFIAKYSHDTHADAARGQLEQVNQDVTAQTTLRRQQQVLEAQAAAAARRHLLADADDGRATLSEMREALIGKTTAQVAALFGPPSETVADKWGYGQRMVYDPQARERRGLTIVFAEGLVQGVDYYYGEAR